MQLIDWCPLLPPSPPEASITFCQVRLIQGEQIRLQKKLNSLVLEHATVPSARANIQHSACKVRNSVPRLRENAVPQQPGLAAFDSTENTFSNRSVEPCICMDWLE